MQADQESTVAEIDERISFELGAKLNLDDDDRDDHEQRPEFEGEGKEGEDESDDSDDDDFTFVCIGDDDSVIPADKVFFDGQIRPVFPLFDRGLLFDGDGDEVSEARLPVRPPVDKVFIESPRRPSSLSPSEQPDEVDGVAAGPYCAWSKDSAPPAEMSKKSNSTGFSKLWRFREKVSRSNSDGRDAFVFLNGPSTSSSSSGAKLLENRATGAGNESSEKITAKEEKVKASGGKVKVKRSKAVSAHEVYLKNKGQNGGDRRRSYLPYRPELMGFFTNVNGGLSRNVHPF